ncbi:hypothetical protein FACS1894122_15060 [Alphaproteobacteria bacterium]|nr:hypothetical protein FACS1894122_15060 [Alphaproteobacteria bacterium]
MLDERDSDDAGMPKLGDERLSNLGESGGLLNSPEVGIESKDEGRDHVL